MFLEKYPGATDRGDISPQQAQLLVAVSHYLDGDYELSQEILEEIWPEIPTETPPQPELIQVVHLASRNLFSLGDQNGLDRWLEDCATRGLDENQTPVLLFMRIRRDFILGDSEAALAGINRYLEPQAGRLTPHIPELLFMRSLTHEMQGELDLAIEDMEIAYNLARYLNLPRSLMNYADWLGILNKQLSRYSESLKWYERAAKHSEGFAKRSPRIYHNSAITLYKLGQFHKALDVLNRFQTRDQLKPEHRSFKLSCLALSRVYCLLRDFNKARRHIRTLEQLIQDPNHFLRERTLAAEFLADIHLAEGQVEIAHSLYRKSLSLTRGTPAEEELAMTLHRRLGECRYLEGDVAGGLEDLNTALATARTRRDRFEEGITLRTMAEAHMAGRDPRAAREAVDLAVVLLGEIEARYEQATALLRSAELALVELERAEPDVPPLVLINRAWGQATHSLDLFLKVGVEWWTEQVRNLLQRISHLKDQHETINGQKPPVAKKRGVFRYHADMPIVHTSSKMRDLLQLCDLYAATDEPVLITGETGTGKELIARRLHDNSNRSPNKLVTVNVTAIPGTLFEREFFGHVSGAFTGADQDGAGFAGQADGGTLFLDEIGDLPLEVQPKLLRLLQEGRYQALGDPAERKTDLRLLAATNADLGTLVREGKFRADLYYRLKILEVNLPPLRERPDDVLPLLRHFLSLAADRPLDPTEVFSPGSLQLLRQYPWPGNVRELAMVARKAQIQLQATGRVEIELDGDGAEPVILSRRKPQEAIADVAESDQELLSIKMALAESCGNRQEAARRLGISRTTLYRKMKALGVSYPG